MLSDGSPTLAYNAYTVMSYEGRSKLTLGQRGHQKFYQRTSPEFGGARLTALTQREEQY